MKVLSQVKPCPSRRLQVLMSLSGDVHHVHSGVALVLPHIPDASSRTGHLVRSFSETTSVRFDDLSEQAIRAYVATGEPFDKAGSYGIQGKAGVFVRGIEGCYFNVMGLPINRLARELSALIDDGLL